MRTATVSRIPEEPGDAPFPGSRGKPSCLIRGDGNGYGVDFVLFPPGRKGEEMAIHSQHRDMEEQGFETPAVFPLLKQVHMVSGPEETGK